MTPLLPALHIPWRSRPARLPRWTPPDYRRPIIRQIRSCWNCGQGGVSFCPTMCRPSCWPYRTPSTDWNRYLAPAVPITPDPAEEAADARIAAVLDAEAAA